MIGSTLTPEIVCGAWTPMRISVSVTPTVDTDGCGDDWPAALACPDDPAAGRPVAAAEPPAVVGGPAAAATPPPAGAAAVGDAPGADGCAPAAGWVSCVLPCGP